MYSQFVTDVASMSELSLSMKRCDLKTSSPKVCLNHLAQVLQAQQKEEVKSIVLGAVFLQHVALVLQVNCEITWSDLAKSYQVTRATVTCLAA